MKRLCCVYLLLANPFVSLPGSALSAQTSNSSTQVLTLAVHDRLGRFVTDILPDQIAIEGQAASVRRFELDNAPRRILLLLDTSGSMGTYKSRAWSNVAQFAIQFTLQRKGDDLIGVDTFAEKDEILAALTMDSQLVVRQVEALTSSGRGRTMLGLALSEILARQENGLRFGDAIILVSDGERSQDDKTDFSRLRSELIRAGVRICLIRVPSVMDLGVASGVTDASEFVNEIGGIELNMVGRPLHQTERGGGMRVDPQTMESVAKAAYAFVRTYYQISLELSHQIQKPSQLHLEVVDQRRRKIKDLQLQYPHYLLPPSTKQ